MLVAEQVNVSLSYGEVQMTISGTKRKQLLRQRDRMKLHPYNSNDMSVLQSTCLKILF